MPGGVEIHFLNGSTVRAQILSEKVEIDTPYGKLSVPVTQIRSIEFGSHMPEGHADKIQAAVKKLGSSDPATKRRSDRRAIMIVSAARIRGTAQKTHDSPRVGNRDRSTVAAATRRA